MAEGFYRSRLSVAAVLGLGGDRTGQDAAGLAIALFHGLLFQGLLDPQLGIGGSRMMRPQTRLLRVLADRGDAS